ncbi:MAG: CoA-binding protein, partial [Sporomusa sp.]
MDLNKLLRPKSLAIIGASDRDGFGGDTTKNLFKLTKNHDKVYLVNPNRDTVLGRKCYPSIFDIDDTVDLCIICTPKKT